MRLLNASSFTIQEFPELRTPLYLILSHTWAADPKEEVLFKDFERGIGLEKSAWHEKVQRFCRLATSSGCEWVWIDTCCIDKSSSAELSEAINSMYRWYSDAIACWVYLVDVQVSPSEEPQESLGKHDGKPKWFTRGWNLQELLAPTQVIFYDQGWNKIGTRETLSESISQLTKIPVSMLAEPQLYEFEFEACYQWIKGRNTTRPEDMAYSLLGLLGVSMPAIYGEGKIPAFWRLLYAIVQWKENTSQTSRRWDVVGDDAFLDEMLTFLKMKGLGRSKRDGINSPTQNTKGKRDGVEPSMESEERLEEVIEKRKRIEKRQPYEAKKPTENENRQQDEQNEVTESGLHEQGDGERQRTWCDDVNSRAEGYISYGAQTRPYTSATARQATYSTSDQKYNTLREAGPNWRWWIPAEGIAREVIQADISRYLGPDAIVRPGGGTGENEASHYLVTV